MNRTPEKIPLSYLDVLRANAKLGFNDKVRWLHALEEMWPEANPQSVSAQKIFPITVDRNLSRAEQVEAGNYDWANSDINDQNFPVGRSEITDTKVNCKLLGFDRTVTGPEALNLIKQDQTILRSATPSETLAFGAQHPEEQRKHFIVGLGPDNRSRWRDGVSWRVPCLYESADGRRLLLHWLVFRFGTDFWFLVVCK